jgi:hypothetical protein
MQLDLIVSKHMIVFDIYLINIEIRTIYLINNTTGI